MPFADVPEFMARLRQRDAMAALALEFTTLTAARTSEALGARWDEIDFKQNIWTVPATRMKGGRAHRVALSRQALAVLEKTRYGAGWRIHFLGTTAGRAAERNGHGNDFAPHENRRRHSSWL